VAFDLAKPRKLQPGDIVAAVTLSWGGPATCPHRYQAGKRQLQEEFGLTVVEMPHALHDAAWLDRNPQARADDWMQACADPAIAGIVSTIGGDDSIRLLPFLDLDLIRTNPKVFMGYSDTTVSHLACLKAGIVSFYGPSIMAGFAENGGMFPYMVASVRRTLFSSSPVGRITPNTKGWTVEFLDWAEPAHQARRRKLNPSTGWHFLQGRGSHRGHLIGGCFEVLDWLRGTSVWPTPEQWRGAILFLETSEGASPPTAVLRGLRTYAAMGILQELSGLCFGRPGGQIEPSQFEDYDQAILHVVREEEGLVDLPVITRMDFGHTDPMFVLPYGVQAEIDCDTGQLAILEAAVRDIEA
jgi:muramoyltetrapeptide carboxypeptidase LdcA involved in peptidoglycan recycling